MHTRIRQSGFTFGNLLLWLIIGGFVILLALKLGPLYMTNATIQSVLNSLKDEGVLVRPITASDVKGQLTKRLFVNGIRDFNTQDTAEFKVQDNKVSITYEERVHIIANVDAIISFVNSVELPTD